ncbi:MAG TPA: hypothetical protein VEV16_09180 [Daejeonella sp.]|nr:hypothetical protein [Daejeonella sp.]
MTRVKEDIINEINGIEDEQILLNIYNLLHSLRDIKSYIQTNDAQKNAIAEARAAKRGTSINRWFI